MLKTSILLTVTILLASTASSAADLNTTRIDRREENQQRRIDQGVGSGALTGREAARLEKGQQHIGTLEERAAADGRVSGRERARIERAQNIQSRRIARQKHDAQRR